MDKEQVLTVYLHMLVCVFVAAERWRGMCTCKI